MKIKTVEQEKVQHALDDLRANGCKIISVLVNSGNFMLLDVSYTPAQAT